MPSATPIPWTTTSRPVPKRAMNTWPGTSVSRNHFEDFLREIGARAEATHLCCIPKVATTHPHVHLSQTSNSNTRSKTRLSLSPETSHHLAHAPTETSSVRPKLERGRTLSAARVSGTLTSGLLVSPKSPALSSISLHATPTTVHDHLPSARDQLVTAIGHAHSPLDGRTAYAPTQARPAAAQYTRRSPDSRESPQPLSPSPSCLHSPSSSSRSRGVAIHSHMRSRSRARSSSRTPSIDSLDTASSSEAPTTPKTQSMLVHDLPPVGVSINISSPSPSPLEELERTSRFSVPSVCMTCKRSGANFPHCGKCGEMWCSRECRTGGHMCQDRVVNLATGAPAL